MPLGWHVTDIKLVQSDDHTDSIEAFEHMKDHIQAELPTWQPWGDPILTSIGGDRVYAQFMVLWSWGFY